MWFYIFCGTIGWAGLLMLVGACLGLSNELEGEDQQGRWPVKWVGRVGLFFVVVAIVFAIGGPSPAHAGLKRIDDGTQVKQAPLVQLAQVAMWPGQEIQFCNGIGAITGGGNVCKHNIYKERIEMTFMNAGWHKTFWGTGTAASLLTSLCRISNVNRVTETVFEPGLVRVRTIPCDTGKSGPWIVVEVPKS
jgi:hypothetical protein